MENFKPSTIFPTIRRAAKFADIIFICGGSLFSDKLWTCLRSSPSVTNLEGTSWISRAFEKERFFQGCTFAKKFDLLASRWSSRHQNKPSQVYRPATRVMTTHLVEGNEANPSCWDTCHVDIWFVVAKYLRPEDTRVFAQICKKTHSVTDSEAFWKSIFNRYIRSKYPWLDIPASTKETCK